MYIIIRAYGATDTRLKRTGQYWQYGIWQVEPGAETDVRANLADYNHAVEIPDRLAQADRYLNADLNHALAIKPLPDGKVNPSYEDLIMASLNQQTKEHKKHIYYLTEQNKKDACDLLKLILGQHIRKWTRLNHESHARNLRTEIMAETDLLKLKKLFAVYFDVNEHWTQQELDAARVHNVHYRYHPDHTLADNV